MSRTIAVIGSGGREYALMRSMGCFGIPVQGAEDSDFDLFVIGPEAPLVDGLADLLRSKGKLVIGPGADGARLEGSKAFMKEVATAAGVPTARHMVASEKNIGEAETFIKELDGRVVVKTDYLAGGKGVGEWSSVKEAVEDAWTKVAGGRAVVIEERFYDFDNNQPYPEASAFALVLKGGEVISLGTARDYKKLLNGNQGPITGGVGALSPVPGLDEESIKKHFFEPTVAELKRRGIDYQGFLYAGLILTPDGPKLLEFNIRFGDPEAQAVLPRLKTNLGELLFQAAQGKVELEVEFKEEVAVTVVLYAQGYAYPDQALASGIINGFEALAADPDVIVFPAGIRQDQQDNWRINGGRVMAVTALGKDFEEARAKVYGAIKRHLSLRNLGHRTDIAQEVC